MRTNEGTHTTCIVMLPNGPTYFKELVYVPQIITAQRTREPKMFAKYKVKTSFFISKFYIRSNLDLDHDKY